MVADRNLPVPASRPPRMRLPAFTPSSALRTPAVPREKPGAELSQLLRWLRIDYTADCQCRGRAAQMDRRGCQWCEENLDTIVGWLAEGAARQGMLFSRFVARRLVKLAIRRARAKAR